MKISVKKAIQVGILTVNIASIFVFILLPSVSFYLLKYYNLSFWIFIFNFFFSFIFMWLYWSVSIVYWKIWAFKHVDNVHHLHESAIRNKLIWEKNSFYNKTEIWSKKQKNKWSIISKRFDIPEELKDDPKIPYQTIITYSKTSLIVLGLLFFLCLTGSVYFFIEKRYLYVCLNLVLAVIFSIEFKKGKNDTFIKLNEKVIQTNFTDVISWNDIKYIKVLRNTKLNNSSITLLFKYEHNGILIQEQMNVQDLSVSHNQLDYLIRIYRYRYHNKHK